MTSSGPSSNEPAVISLEELCKLAADLRSEDGENAEYDRALVELCCDAIGYPLEEGYKRTMAEELGIKRFGEPTQIRRLLDFIEAKAEAGDIRWDNDAPVFYGLVEEVEMLVEGHWRRPNV